MTSPPRVSFKTVGCRLNQAETAQMAARFLAAGYALAHPGQPCDVCVVHTCAVTAAAVRKCARFARAARKLNPSGLLVLAGCAAEASGPRLAEETGADVLAGQREKFDLPRLLLSARGEARRASARAVEPNRADPALTPHFDSTRALVKVQDGCDFGCAYCIVPLVRGAQRSRPLRDVVGEARRLAQLGYLEVVLSGANLGSYRDGHRSLVDLIRELERIDEIRRIRLSSVEPTTVERPLVDLITSSDKLCRYLHVPLQSGDDRVLSLMGRRYTAEQFRAWAEYAAGRIPRLGLGTDLLVGHPGEDRHAFDATVRLVGQLPFSNLHVFPYSPRPGTRSAALPDSVPAAQKRERVAHLQAIAREKKRCFARSLLGQDVSVLVERIRTDGTGRGWTSEYVAASVPPPLAQRNHIVRFVPAALNGGLLC